MHKAIDTLTIAGLFALPVNVMLQVRQLGWM